MGVDVFARIEIIRTRIVACGISNCGSPNYRISLRQARHLPGGAEGPRAAAMASKFFKRERGGAQGGQITLDQCLSDPVNLNYFKKFCMKEMSMENLLFWLEVQDFKTIEAPQYAGFIARKIYNKYIRVGAHQQLAVEGNLRENIQATFKPDLIRPDVFDEIQEEAAKMMRLDIFPRFQSDDLYTELIQLKFEERKVESEPPHCCHRTVSNHASAAAASAANTATFVTVADAPA